MKIVWIGAAGFLGALARYGVEGWVSERTKGSFPFGTLVVNVTGCFLLGLIMALLTGRLGLHPNVQPAVTIGFLGAYTTFSTFAFESMRLAEDGATLSAAINIGASIALGIAAVYAGTWVGKTL